MVEIEEKPDSPEEIEESHEQDPLLPKNQTQKSKQVKTKVPEIEVRLYKQGKGPIDVFNSSLGGWDQDQLEVKTILEKYGFKSIFAFNPGSGRGVAIRFNPRNGRSLLSYKDGSVVYIDGEPKDSLIKPITRILFGVAAMTFVITMLAKDPPELMKKMNLAAGNLPPWVLACIIIVFTRMRKRTKDMLRKFGW